MAVLAASTSLELFFCILFGMEKHTHTTSSAIVMTQESIEKRFVGDVEAAAAKDEPMGSIAAAVPGDDKVAEDSLRSGLEPGGGGVRSEAGERLNCGHRIFH